MPFVSQSQRALFYAAAASKALAKRKGLTKETIDKFVEHDVGGKLPEKAKAT